MFDARAAVVATRQTTFESSFSADVWVKQDPEVIWRTTLSAVRDALDGTGLDRQGIHRRPPATPEKTLLWPS